MPAFVEDLIVLASPDPARLAPDLLGTGPGMRPSLEWDGRGEVPSGEQFLIAAFRDRNRMMVDQLELRSALNYCCSRSPLSPEWQWLVFEEAKAYVRQVIYVDPQYYFGQAYVTKEGDYAVETAQLALAISPPGGPFDPIQYAVQRWPEPHLDEASIEVLLDALIARAATAHLEYLRDPTEHHAIRVREEYEMVLDVLALIESDADLPPG